MPVLVRIPTPLRTLTKGSAEVQAKGNVPAFSLALAVSRGRDPVSLLPQLVGAVSGAVTSCPAFVAEEKESVTALNFTVTGGKMKVTPRLDPSAGVKCLVSTLDGKDVSGGDRMLPPSRVVGAEPHDVGPLNATSSLDGRLEIKIKMSTGAAKTP